MSDLMSERMKVLLVLGEERSHARPNEAVVTACEVALRNMPDLEERVRMYIELSQGDER